MTTPDRRSGSGWRFGAVAAVVVALLGGGLALLRHLRDEPEHPVTTDVPVPTTEAPAPITAGPTSTASTTTAFGPTATLDDIRDVSFADAQHGWALVGTGPASSDLLSTADGGRTWASTGTNTDDAYRVVFADASNGWMYMSSLASGSFRSTHDGGRTWHDIDLATAQLASAPFGLASDGTTVAIVAAPTVGTQPDSWILATSPVDRDDFTRAGLAFPQGAGPVTDFSVAVESGDVWVVDNDRTVVDTGRLIDGTASEWPVPWSDLFGSASVAVSRGGTLYATVWAGQWSGPTVEYQVYVSSDRGTTFTRVNLPIGSEAVSADITPVEGNTVLALISTSNGASTLYRSDDAGITWAGVPSFPTDAAAPILAADGSALVAIRYRPDGVANAIVLSTDGGVTWTSPS